MAVVCVLFSLGCFSRLMFYGCRTKSNRYFTPLWMRLSSNTGSLFPSSPPQYSLFLEINIQFLVAVVTNCLLAAGPIQLTSPIAAISFLNNSELSTSFYVCPITTSTNERTVFKSSLYLFIPSLRPCKMFLYSRYGQK